MTQPEIFKSVSLFVDLQPAEIEMLADDFGRRQFRQGDTIFHEGDDGNFLYIIESGRVRIFVHSSEGQETSVIVYGPGDMFGELALIDGLPRSASAIALDDAVVYSLNGERFREHTRNIPQLALNFMKALSVRVRYSTQQVGSLSSLDVPRRLARKLLELAYIHGEPVALGVSLNITLTQSDLASFTGATRESVNKALGSFRRRSMVAMDEGKIVITDAEALRSLISGR